MRVKTVKRNSTLNLLTVMKWVNDDLLPSLHLPESYHTSFTSRTTCWRWMVSLGFDYSKYQKGYVDGHERPDVMKEQKAFIKEINALEEQSQTTTNMLWWCSTLSYPLGNVSADENLVLFYHDETTFHSNEGRKAGWHVKGEWPLLPNDQGRSSMVSDFIVEFGASWHLLRRVKEKRWRRSPWLRWELSMTGTMIQTNFVYR